MADTKNIEEQQDAYETHDVPALRAAPAGVLEEGSLDPVYEAKAKVLVSKLCVKLDMLYLVGAMKQFQEEH
jgi:hypothetical protein